MNVIRGVLKVAGTAVLGVTGTTAAILKAAVESTGNDADILESIQNSSFKTIGKIWGTEIEETSKSEAEIRMHQIDVRQKGMATAKRYAEMARKEGNEAGYENMMRRYEELKEEIDTIKYSHDDDIDNCEGIDDEGDDEE